MPFQKVKPSGWAAAQSKARTGRLSSSGPNLSNAGWSAPTCVAVVNGRKHYTKFAVCFRTVALPGGYTLTVGNDGTVRDWKVGYEFRMPDGAVVFSGADWKPPPSCKAHDDGGIADLLSWLTLRPKDTDLEERFEAYGMRQWAFLAHHEDVEELKILAMLVEEGRESFEDAEPPEEEADGEA